MDELLGKASVNDLGDTPVVIAKSGPQKVIVKKKKKKRAETKADEFLRIFKDK